MKLQIRRISYKILVISMITVALSFFLATSVSQAKLKIKPGEYFYSGTQEGEYVVEASIWEKVLEALSEIADYILGIMTLGFRGVVVGWIAIMEIILTLLLDPNKDIAQIAVDSVTSVNGYTDDVITIEKILFNEVKILDANLFK